MLLVVGVLFFNYYYFLNLQFTKTTESTKNGDTGLSFPQAKGVLECREREQSPTASRRPLTTDLQPKDPSDTRDLLMHHSGELATFNPEDYCRAQLSLRASDCTPPT